jgi:hypothetical protein
MMLTVAAALYAQAESNGIPGDVQYANVKVWVAPVEGGSEEDRAYFDFNLPEEVKGSGYELTETMEEADFYIICTLDYDTEYEDNIITAELYDGRTDAQIITTSMGYQTTDEMNDWNLTMIYRLMANAPISKTLSMDESEFVRAAEYENNKKVYPEYKLFLGLRAGYSQRFYTRPSESLGQGNTFEAALHVSYQPWRYVGFQTEALFTMDSAALAIPDLNPTEYITKIDEYKSGSLMIPLMVKGIFRFNRLVVSPLAGVYLTLPLGQMTTDNGKSAFLVTPPLGGTAGAELGMHLGPGLLFLDIRYAADFGPTVLKGETTVYRRSMVSFSLGYKFGLLKKPEAPPVSDSQATP